MNVKDMFQLDARKVAMNKKQIFKMAADATAADRIKRECPYCGNTPGGPDREVMQIDEAIKMAVCHVRFSAWLWRAL